MNTFLATIFLILSLSFFVFLIYLLISFNFERSASACEIYFFLFIFGFLFWIISHFAPTGYSYIERIPTNSEYYGTTIMIDGEKKTITNHRNWKGTFEFSDGTSADDGYVRKVSNVKKYTKAKGSEWKWYWERFKKDKNNT